MGWPLISENFHFLGHTKTKSADTDITGNLLEFKTYTGNPENILEFHLL